MEGLEFITNWCPPISGLRNRRYKVSGEVLVNAFIIITTFLLELIIKCVQRETEPHSARIPINFSQSLYTYSSTEIWIRMFELH